MKYKHGFIGNSSSASYYIRRGYRSTVDGTMDGFGGGTAAEEGVSTGHTTDSYYSWHPRTTAVMRASLVVPIANGAETNTGVNEISFRFYGLVRRDHAAANVTEATEYDDASFATGAHWATNWLYTVDTSTDYSMGVDDSWDLTLGDAGLVQGAPGDYEESGFELDVSWDGEALRIVGSYSKPSGSHVMSCAIGINGFTATQDETP